jgi:hypothetical protein
MAIHHHGLRKDKTVFLLLLGLIVISILLTIIATYFGFLPMPIDAEYNPAVLTHEEL